MLVFCPACGNIMTLKEKRYNIGVYICRNCDSIKKIKVKPVEIKENVKYIAPPVPVARV